MLAWQRLRCTVQHVMREYHIPVDIADAIICRWETARATALVRWRPTPIPQIVRVFPFSKLPWVGKYKHTFCRGNFDYCSCHTDKVGMLLRNKTTRWKRSLLETMVVLEDKTTGVRCGTEIHLLAWEKNNYFLNSSV